MASPSEGQKRDAGCRPAGARAPWDGVWVTLARLVKTQGRHGELAAELLTDIPNRFASLRQVWLCHPSGRRQAFPLAHHWMHQGRIVLGFEGIADLTAAAAWIGADVQIPRAERAPAPEGRYFLSDLEGCTVFDHGRPIGRIEAIEEVSGAAALLHLRGADGNELLIPFAAAHLLAVDLSARRLEMATPEGLLEINQ